jgi:hypothetical protein
VRHGVGKISTRATTSVQTSSRSKSAVESYGGSKFRESRRDNFGTISGLHFGSPGNLCHLDVGAAYTIGSMVVAYSRGPGRGVSRGPKCPWLVPTPKGVPNAKLTSCGWFLDVDSSLIY